jgi:hypothetical protein
LIELTANGNIEDVTELTEEQERGWYVIYRFYVQLDYPDGEVFTYYINHENFHIHDQYGSLLNPDGWPWPLPERILTPEEAMNRLMYAATWHIHQPGHDKMVDDIKLYCFAAYRRENMPDGTHIGYNWVNSITGEVTQDFFDWVQGYD